MDTDMVLTRGQIAGLRELVQQDAKRRLLADQDSAWELADLLKSALRIPRDEAPQFRLVYGPAAEQSEMSDRLTQVYQTAARMTGVAVGLADRLTTLLQAAGRDEDCADLLTYMAEVLAGMGELMGRNFPPGSFATPPGTIGVWAVPHTDEEQPDRLFLRKQDAEAYDAAHDRYGAEPRVVWGRPDPPEKVDVHRYTVEVRKDGGVYREFSSPTLQDQSTDQYAHVLAGPQVQVIDRSAPEGWTVYGEGTDMAQLHAAVKAEAKRLMDSSH